MHRTVAALSKRNSLTFRKAIPRGTPRPDAAALARRRSDRERSRVSLEASRGRWFGPETLVRSLESPWGAIRSRVAEHLESEGGEPGKYFGEGDAAFKGVGKGFEGIVGEGEQGFSLKSPPKAALDIAELGWSTGVTDEMRDAHRDRALRYLALGPPHRAAQLFRESLKQRHQRQINIIKGVDPDSGEPIPGAEKLPIIAGCILERLPVVVPLPTPAEEAHDRAVDLHASETRKHLTPGWERMGAPDPMDAVARKRQEEKTAELKAAFEAGMAGRVPENGADRRVIDRHLPKRVYLVRPVDGETLPGMPEGAWAFPSARRARGESMLEAAMRAARESLGSGVTLHPVSALPVAHHVYRAGAGKGARVFFFRVQYVAGRVEPDDAREWLSLWELKDRLDADYLASVRPSLRK